MKYLYNLPKSLLVILFCSLLCTYSVAATTNSTTLNTNSSSQEELQFFLGSFEQALDMAEHMKMNVFVYVYKDFESRKPELDFFSNNAVASLYRKKYVNLKVNLNSATGVKFFEQYNLRSFPAMLYFSKDGRLLGAQSDLEDADEVLHWGKVYSSKAIYTEHTKKLPTIYREFLDLKNQYNNGRRDASFLYHYAYMLEKFNEPYEHVVEMYIDRCDIRTNESLNFLFHFAKDVDSHSFKHLVSNQAYFSKIYQPHNLEAKLKAAITQTVTKAANQHKRHDLNRAMNVLSRIDMSNRGLFMAEMKTLYFEVTQDWDNYARVTYDWITQSRDIDACSVNEIAWDYAVNVNDKKLLGEALSWVNNLVEQQPKDLTFQQTSAALHYQLGKRAKAIKIVDTAIESARQRGLDYTSFIALREIIMQNKALNEKAL